MLERAWVGGQAPRFEQELAERRQALQRAWAGLLEEIADDEQRSKRLLDFQPRLSVPSMTSTAELGGGSCYPPGAFTGVDVEGFEALARELLAVGPALSSAVQAMPAEAASGSVFGVETEQGPWSACLPVSRPQARVILEIGEWAREQGQQIAGRLEMIRRGEGAAVTGLTAPNSLTGPMVSAAMAGTVLFAPSLPEATQT
ncbi:MAG: Pimeloyl-ACP methyl ester carboxylesterase, partial [Actinomycetota bacterium]|nr:Pimeloyl-ACP methyl ester carboxylesterase [Actinomycetota bacterium]